MLEPKLIWTSSSWQPYVLVGAGVAINSYSDYSETKTDPNGSAVPTSTPFNNGNLVEFAYELGIGIQHPLTSEKNSPIIALDYRFMNWGNTGLSSYTGQPTDNALSFGRLETSAVNLSLIWPF